MDIVIACIVIYGLFSLMCYLGTGGDQKNMKSFYSYPDAVQEQVRKDEKLSPMIPAKKSAASAFISNTVLFTVVFVIAGFILHLDQFLSAFLILLAVGEGLNLFDLIVIDRLWWSRTARTRFSSVPDPDLYKNMDKHVGSFVRGIPVFVCSALVSALVLALVL